MAKYKITARHSKSGNTEDIKQRFEGNFNVKGANLAWFTIRSLVDSILEETYGEYVEIEISRSHYSAQHTFRMWRSEDNDYSFAAEIDGEPRFMGSHWDEYLSGWL